MSQIVKMQGMNKYFGKLHVLKDIDLTVEAGEVVVIIGASGSGKSTLIRCVNGLEPFESGKLEVDGHPLAPKGGNQKSLTEIRKEVGMVFQQFNPVPPPDGEEEHHAGTDEGQENAPGGGQRDGRTAAATGRYC